MIFPTKKKYQSIYLKGDTLRFATLACHLLLTLITVYKIL